MFVTFYFAMDNLAHLEFPTIVHKITFGREGKNSNSSCQTDKIREKMMNYVILTLFFRYVLRFRGVNLLHKYILALQKGNYRKNI